MYTKHDSCKLQYCLSLRVEFQGRKLVVDPCRAVLCTCYENVLIPVLPQFFTPTLAVGYACPETAQKAKFTSSICGLTKAASCADMICIKYLRNAKMLLGTLRRQVVQKQPQCHFFKSYIRYTPAENTCDTIFGPKVLLPLESFNSFQHSSNLLELEIAGRFVKVLPHILVEQCPDGSNQKHSSNLLPVHTKLEIAGRFGKVLPHALADQCPTGSNQKHSSNILPVHTELEIALLSHALAEPSPPGSNQKVHETGLYTVADSEVQKGGFSHWRAKRAPEMFGLPCPLSVT